MAADIICIAQEAVRVCLEDGIAVICGNCPSRFLKPDFGPALIPVIWRSLGFLKVSENGPSKATALPRNFDHRLSPTPKEPSSFRRPSPVRPLWWPVQWVRNSSRTA